jgi:hypothetical protein
MVHRQFLNALTRGGANGQPRPIEFQSHNPVRYSRIMRCLIFCLHLYAIKVPCKHMNMTCGIFFTRLCCRMQKATSATCWAGSTKLWPQKRTSWCLLSRTNHIWVLCLRSRRSTPTIGFKNLWESFSRRSVAHSSYVWTRSRLQGGRIITKEKEEGGHVCVLSAAFSRSKLVFYTLTWTCRRYSHLCRNQTPELLMSPQVVHF